MEAQTRFDLNTAIENWRAGLSAQSNLTTEARRELETHLRDSMAGLRAHGLDEAEAFWVARRRVGQPQQLEEEFVKADPARVWRERIFWILLAALLFETWNSIPWFIKSLLGFSTSNGAARSLVDMLVLVLQFFPLIVVGLLCAGKLTSQFSEFGRFIKGRFRLVATASVLIVTSGILRYAAALVWAHQVAAVQAQVGIVGMSRPVSILPELEAIWPLIVMVFLLLWLLPMQKYNTPKHA